MSGPRTRQRKSSHHKQFPERSRPAKRAVQWSETLARFWSLHSLPCFLILSAVWVTSLYARALTEPFVYDDVLAIQQNPALWSWHDIARYFQSPVDLNNDYRGFAGSIYRPLTWLGYVADNHLSESNPIGFHFTNLAIHWANAAIGFLLLCKLRISPIIAASTCMIWLGLPINSEAVAWISGRSTCQATFFILTGLLTAAYYLQKSSAMLLLGYSLAVAGAILSNESGILALPLTGLLIFVEGRFKEQKAWGSLCAAALATFTLVLTVRHAVGANLPLGSVKVAPIGLSFLKYLAWIVLPVHMSMERSTDTPSNEVTIISLAALTVVLGFLFLVAVELRRRAPRIAASLAWAAICLLPFCGIVFIYQGMAERYTYLASAGIVLAIVLLADYAKERIKRIILSVVFIWLVWGAWRLEARLVEWGDETLLFKSSLAVNPRSPILLYNLGSASAAAGRIQEAITFYRRALEVNPDYLSVLVNLGNLLRDQGDYSAALSLQRRAIAVGPVTADLWVNLGATYLKVGPVSEATVAFQKALSLNPKSFDAAIDLGAAFQSIEDWPAAIQQYRRAIAIDPHQGAAYCNLGALFLQRGDFSAATAQFEDAIRNNPLYAPAYFDLGLAYESSGQKELAIPMFEKALQLKPNDRNAAHHLNLCRRN